MMVKRNKEQILRKLEQKGLKRLNDTTSTEKLSDDVKRTLKKMIALELEQQNVIKVKKEQLLSLTSNYLKVVV